MHRLSEHALLLAGAAIGAVTCLELVNLERSPANANAAVSHPVPLAPAGMPMTRFPIVPGRPAAIKPEPSRPTPSRVAEPTQPKLVAPPTEAKRPPKPALVAQGEPARAKRADAPPKPPGFVQSLLSSVTAALGTN